MWCSGAEASETHCLALRGCGLSVWTSLCLRLLISKMKMIASSYTWFRRITESLGATRLEFFLAFGHPCKCLLLVVALWSVTMTSGDVFVLFEFYLYLTFCFSGPHIYCSFAKEAQISLYSFLQADGNSALLFLVGKDQRRTESDFM